MVASLAEAFGELLLLLIVLLPTGLSVLRGFEALLRHRFRLTPIERGILGFYAAGTLLFVFASIPLPIFGPYLLATVLILGTVGYAFCLARGRASGFRAVLASLRAPSTLIVGAGAAGLLVFELAPIWNHSFPNAWDGSVTALWTHLILRQHTIPTTLAPFASAPVMYPLATSVWMSVPVMLFGWPVVEAPILLPPLFLSFTVPAAYAWGARWSQDLPHARATVAMVFAAFFGLISGVPRLYTGGWYDFALVLPLLMVTFGVTPDWARGPRSGWPMLVGFGLVCGSVTALSLAAGEAAIVLALAFVLVRYRRATRELLSRLGQVAVLVLFEIAFVVRSVIEWWAYQGLAYVPKGYYGTLDPRLAMGELNPFVPWKAKFSPFPWVALEMQLLLVGGCILLGVALLRPASRPAKDLGRTLPAFLLTGAVASFLMTAFLLLTALTGSPWAELGRVTNLDQASVVLFLFLAGIAVLPLAVAAAELTTGGTGMAATGRRSPAASESGRTPSRARRRSGSRWNPIGIALVLLLVVPLTVGAVSTVVEGPGYLESNVGKTSNVTAGDVEALEWAGAHLPSCSVVLVAPGSAAQFLPEYATVRIAYPMNPVVTNSSYGIAVENLTHGVYGPETRMALTSLGVTEVFVTGQTSVSFAPFLPQPLESSSDFSLVESSGDAMIFTFLPVLASADCSP